MSYESQRFGINRPTASDVGEVFSAAKIFETGKGGRRDVLQVRNAFPNVDGHRYVKRDPDSRALSIACYAKAKNMKTLQ